MDRKIETPGEQPWSQPQLYEIRFKGHLSPYRAQVFEGLEMVQEPGGDTMLTGPVIDQAALHGILNRIRDLGVPLLAVKQISTNAAGVRRSLSDESATRSGIHGHPPQGCAGGSEV